MTQPDECCKTLSGRSHLFLFQTRYCLLLIRYGLIILIKFAYYSEKWITRQLKQSLGVRNFCGLYLADFAHDGFSHSGDLAILRSGKRT